MYDVSAFSPETVNQVIDALRTIQTQISAGLRMDGDAIRGMDQALARVNVEQMVHAHKFRVAEQAARQFAIAAE